MLPEGHLETLTALGLTPSEARLYLAAVRVPGARVQALAREADVPRSRAYRVLARLEARGLVRERPGVSKRYDPLALQPAVQQLVAEKYAHLAASAERARNLLDHGEWTLDAALPDPGDPGENTTAPYLEEALANARRSILVSLQGVRLPGERGRPVAPRIQPGVCVRVVAETDADHPLLWRSEVQVRTRPRLGASWVVIDGGLTFFRSTLLAGAEGAHPIISESDAFARALTESFEAAWAHAQTDGDRVG